ncbi:hypothetical protein SAMN04490194_1980 [Pseudomonas migulae]|uniref:Uncharacterized protein n=1 Tax=Pseudomonas migulae TaxID=78543 RepID=A0A1H5IBG0_9PSED|nr:hypothetical protein SAMN04490194_1980 [Pseudomonas migulae]
MRWRPRNWLRGFVSLLATRRSLRRCCRPSCDLVQSSAKRANLDGFALFCVRVFGVGFALGSLGGAIRPPSPASRLLHVMVRRRHCWGGLLAMRPEMRWRPRNWLRGFVSLLATRRSLRRCCRPSCDLVQSSAKRANLDGFALFCVRVFGVGFALGSLGGAIRPPSPASRLLHVMVRRRHCWGGLLAMRPEMRWRPRNWLRGFVSLLATRRSLRRCCRPSCDLVQSSAKRANLDGFALFCVRVFGVGFALGNWGAIRPPSPASRLLHVTVRRRHCWGGLLAMRPEMRWRPRNWLRGIRQFARDQEKLEALLQAKL